MNRKTFRTKHPSLLAAVLAIIFITSAPAVANRDPGPGGSYWPMSPRIGQTGIGGQYADGLNLYQYVRSMPTRFLDPLGLESQGTGVFVCYRYIRGDAFWDIQPSHTWLMVDGVGYGLYANSHVGGDPGSSYERTLWDKSVVANDDQLGDKNTFLFEAVGGGPSQADITNKNRGVAQGDTYSNCFEIYVNDKCYDAEKFKAAIKQWVDDQVKSYESGTSPTYSVIFNNCSDWVKSASEHGLSKSASVCGLKRAFFDYTGQLPDGAWGLSNQELYD